MRALLLLVGVGLASVATAQPVRTKVTQHLYNLDSPEKLSNPCSGTASQTTIFDTETCVPFGTGSRKWHCDFVRCGNGEFNTYYESFSDSECKVKTSSSEVTAQNRCLVSADNTTAVRYTCDRVGPASRVGQHWCCSLAQERCQYHTHYSNCENDDNCRWCNLTIASDFPRAIPMCQPRNICVDRSNAAQPRILGGSCSDHYCRVAALECDQHASEGACKGYTTFNGEGCQWCKDNKVAECAYRPSWRCDVREFDNTVYNMYIRYERDTCPAVYKLNGAAGLAPSVGLLAALTMAVVAVTSSVGGWR